MRSLILALQSKGHSVIDLGCPELDRSDSLNVDARFDIDGVIWAVEHSRVVHDPNMIAAHQFAEKNLRAFGDEIARKYSVRLSIAFYPPRWHRRNGPPTAYFNRIRDRMEASAHSGFNDHDDNCQIFVSSESSEFEMSFFTANDPLVRNQLLKGIREPLLKKHRSQFEFVRAEGVPLLLLLDQADDPDSKMHAQWIFAINTLRDVLLEIFQETSSPVNEVWLRRPHGECVSVIPPDDTPVVDGLDYLWR
jgi:hypothetical protein